MKSSKILLGILVVVIIIVVVSVVASNLEAPTIPSSGADTSSWKIYSNAQPSFSIKAPVDLVLSTSTIPTIDSPYLLALQFPKDAYFSTVLKDETYVIITASSTCPTTMSGPIDKGPETLVLNGLTKNDTSDAAAGNHYLTVTYDTNKNGLCYRVTFFDHGANGAGLYLSDPVAIKTADETYAVELAKIKAIVLDMVGTFSLPASQ